MNSRDSRASLKMHGALLRLDALSPHGFTWRELAQHAEVSEETARDFLKPDRRPDVLEEIETSAIPMGEGKAGRPRKVFRVSKIGRQKLLRQVAALRRELDSEASSVSNEVDVFAALQLLEDTVEQLEAGREAVEDWDDLLEEAVLEYRGCRAEQRALLKERAAIAVKYSTRLHSARQRLYWAKRGEAPQKVLDPYDIVHKFGGQWLTAKPHYLEPAVVLFDCMRTSTTITSRLVEACELNRYCVVSFPVAKMKDDERTRLYSWFDNMRVATPLAVCDFVLAIDGKTRRAPQLAAEFCDFARPGQWNDGSHRWDTGLLPVDVDVVRRHYIKWLAEVVVQHELTFAKRCLSTLSTLDASKVSPQKVHSPSYMDHWRSDRQDVARRLMGSVVCLDSSNNPALKQTFSGHPVTYHGGVAAGGALNLNEILGRYEVDVDLRSNG